MSAPSSAPTGSRPPVRLHDPGALDAALAGQLRAAFDGVLTSGRYVLGEPVAAFEAGAGAALGGVHAIGVSSGSDALWLALAALDVGPGDEVVTTPFSFFATVGATLRRGAVPVFADVDPDTLCLDPAAALAARTARTRAFLPVHLYGHPAELGPLLASGLPVLEDAAQAFGGWSGAGALGALGALGAFSCFPTKPLAALGDGGLVATRDAALAERVRRLRQHGAAGKHLHAEVGANCRLDALQAAFLSVKLPHVRGWQARRAALAARLRAALTQEDGLVLPPTAPGAAWALFTVRVRGGRRDALAAHLAARGIETAVHYPRALHRQPALAALGLREGAFPVAEAAAREVLSLPCHAALTDAEADRVVDAVRGFFGGA